jgi:NAD-dependent dihydropyrimidine dehydrogenase PreA subunit
MRVVIDPELCESTGVCADVCPEAVFEHENGTTRVVNPQACTNCWICVDHCVSGAIEIG